MIKNEYLPFASHVISIKKHTDIEYTFRMTYNGEVKPGQFFEISIPKFGEAPISVSGIGNGYIELTIRRVGKVTSEIFERYEGGTLFMRGPYGNGFDTEEYKDSELLITAGGTGLSPVRGVIEYFAENPGDVKSLTVITGFKTSADILFKEDISRWRQQASELILTVDTGDAAGDCRTGLVTDHLPKLRFKDTSKAKAIVVGPPAMMKFTSLGLLGLGFKEENITISYERRMCCGIGKCGHCKIDNVYVCLDGPVFNYKDAKALAD